MKPDDLDHKEIPSLKGTNERTPVIHRYRSDCRILDPDVKLLPTLLHFSVSPKFSPKQTPRRIPYRTSYITLAFLVRRAACLKQYAFEIAKNAADIGIKFILDVRRNEVESVLR